MKINFDSKIKNLKNENMKLSTDGKESDVILKDVSINALLADIREQGVKPETGREKLKKFKLARKIDAGGEIELTAEEISLIKEKIGKGYSTLVVGRAYELLEQVDQKN